MNKGLRDRQEDNDDDAKSVLTAGLDFGTRKNGLRFVSANVGLLPPSSVRHEKK